MVKDLICNYWRELCMVPIFYIRIKNRGIKSAPTIKNNSVGADFIPRFFLDGYSAI